MRQLVVILALALAACSTTPSSPMSSDRTELARRYAKMLAVPGVLEASFKAYIDEIRTRFPTYAENCRYDPNPANCRRIVTLATADVNAMLDGALEAVLGYQDALVEADAKTYASIYTVAELQANIAFFESPIGRSTLSKAPAVAKGLTENQYSVLRPWMDELDARMIAIFASYGYELEPQPDSI